MTGAVYLTIWIAVALFAAGEAGRARDPHRTRWPWHVSALGLALSLVHTLLAFAVVHDWSHSDAIRHTAAQTERVFGRPFGQGIYANYLFYGVWLIDLTTWRRSGGIHTRSPSAILWLSAFYFVIVSNAAVVFAQGWRRGIGGLLLAVLLTAWATQIHRAQARRTDRSPAGISSNR